MIKIVKFMAAICYSDAISTVLTNGLLGEKTMGEKFQSNISKTEVLVSVYTDRRIDGHD